MKFYGEKALECIVKALKPDVMIKGSDYECTKITGQRYCKRIAFVPHTGDSSLEIRRKIRTGKLEVKR